MKRKAFTLIELIISVFISAIVLIFLFGIVANVVRDIQFSIDRSKLLSSLSSYVSQMNNFRNIYLSGSVLHDYGAGAGADVLLMTDLEGENGVLFGVVNPEKSKLDDIVFADYATRKVLGYRELSQTEITQLLGDPSVVYSYDFHQDKWLEGILIKDFQVDFYNSQDLLDITFEVNQNLKSNDEPPRYSETGNTDIEKFIFNF